MVKRMPSVGATALAFAVLLASASGVRAECKLVEIAEFHVDPGSSRPVVDGEINGQPVKILFDLGSGVSLIPVSEAKRLGLAMSRLEGVRMYGFGGDVAAYDANIKELKVGDFKVGNLALVASGDEDTKSPFSLVLGDDFFSRTDVELDLRDNVVRLFNPQGCAPPQLVYWGHAYSQATILPWERDSPSTQVMATVNGKQVLAELDTGASVSIIDEVAAEAAGVARPADAKVEASRGGIGPRPTDVWRGRFDSLALGDEKLSNIHLQIAHFARGMSYADTGTMIRRQLASTPYLLIGADFLHAHRVFIDNKDHLILFSYEGGPVFQQAPAAASAGH